MQVAHAGHDQFFGLPVAVEMEGGVLFDDFVQSAGEFGFVAAALGRHGKTNHRCGKLYGGQFALTQRGAGVQIFHLRDRHNVARSGGIEGAGFTGLNFQQRAHLDALAGRGGLYVGVFFQRPGKRRE